MPASPTLRQLHIASWNTDPPRDLVSAFMKVLNHPLTPVVRHLARQVPNIPWDREACGRLADWLVAEQPARLAGECAAWNVRLSWLARQLRQRQAGAATTPEDADSAPVEAPQYVTLIQMASLVNKTKATLERRKGRPTNPLPDPDIEGGGGRADEWIYHRVRPWLEREFNRQLPERFPNLHLGG